MIKNILQSITARNAKKDGYSNPSTKERSDVRYSPLSGYRKDCRIYFKSKMEANVYRFYKYKSRRHKRIINVAYEPELFMFKSNPYGIRGYKPDIKIDHYKGSFYIEVKGVVDLDCRRKAYLLKRDYPWVKLCFITPSKYELIKRHYSHLIPNWE
jgi:hypothetical protein